MLHPLSNSCGATTTLSFFTSFPKRGKRLQNASRRLHQGYIKPQTAFALADSGVHIMFTNAAMISARSRLYVFLIDAAEIGAVRTCVQRYRQAGTPRWGRALKPGIEAFFVR
jgi:hypothetical protein